jgi:ribosome maturation factor RimP
LKGSFDTAQAGGPPAPSFSAALPHPFLPDLERLAQAAVVATGFELKGVNVFTHRIPMTVQVLVQRADGSDINLDECASLSAPLAEAIEAAELLGDAYLLEVSSPGVSDDLRDDRDFRSFRGFPVVVLCRDDQGLDIRREGLLLERDATDVHLNIHGRTQRIPRGSVISVCLVTPSESD